MKTLPNSVLIEKNRYDSDNPFLFLLDITLLNSVSVDLRFVRNYANIWFAGNEYTAFPFDIENRGESSKGEIPTLTIKIVNVSRELRSYLTAYGGLVNSKMTLSVISYDVAGNQVLGNYSLPITGCTLPTANKDYINKTGIGVTGLVDDMVNIKSGTGALTGMYTIIAKISDDSIQINSNCHASGTDIVDAVVQICPKGTVVDYADLQVTYTVLATNYDVNFITLQLGAAYITRRRFPLNRYIPNNCQWLRNFKGLECGYTGTITTCIGTLEDCRLKGNSVRFGGYRGLGSGNLRLV